MKKTIIILFAIIFIISTCIIVEYTNTKDEKDEIKLTQLSSESGDRMMGYVIRTNNGKTIVVDGGLKEDATNLKQCIEKYGNKVDYWFITHPHDDHVGAFIEIVNKTEIEIDKIYYSLNSIEWYEKHAVIRIKNIQEFFNTLENDKIKSKTYQPQIGEHIEISKNINVEILGIKNEEITTNAVNNSSMVFKLHVNDKTIMFLGDTGTESSDKLVKMYTKNDLKSDIVQISHHGNNGATKQLYELIEPEICLWPTPNWLWNNDSGEGYNSGDWTTLETKQWIRDMAGVQANYVAKDGNITIIVK